PCRKGRSRTTRWWCRWSRRSPPAAAGRAPQPESGSGQPCFAPRVKSLTASDTDEDGKKFPRRGARLELIPAQPAIDRQPRAGDVAGQRRGEEDGEHGKVLGLAPIADRNLLAGEALAIVGRIVAPDLLAHDAAGRDRVDGDAVAPQLARQALGPGMHRRL